MYYPNFLKKLSLFLVSSHIFSETHTAHRFMYAHLSKIGRMLVNAYLSRTELSFVKSAVTRRILAEF